MLLLLLLLASGCGTMDALGDLELVTGRLLSTGSCFID
jgi:hypothetical protein